MFGGLPREGGFEGGMLFEFASLRLSCFLRNYFVELSLLRMASL